MPSHKVAQVNAPSASSSRSRARVELRGLGRSFGSVKALDGFDLEIGPGELVALLGPSGSGKTTVLRVLAGLEGLDKGQVLLDGVDITHMPAFRRGMGMVFQAYSLFPNMTALGNVSFGLKLRGLSRSERSKRASELLELVGLGPEAGRYPHQLSGGQQQRVALARALAIEPRVLLLDEPLSALDARVRSQLRDEIRRVQQEVGITALFVTHDQEEALSIADRVGVMRSGVLEQIGSPSEIYEHPETAFVAEFVGSVNRLPGVVVENGKVSVLGTLMPLEKSVGGRATSSAVQGASGTAGAAVVTGGAGGAGGSGSSGMTPSQWTIGTPVDVLVRAEAVSVTPKPESDHRAEVAGGNGVDGAEVVRGRVSTGTAPRARGDGASGGGCEGRITSRAFLGPVLRLGIVVNDRDGNVRGHAGGLAGAEVSGSEAEDCSASSRPVGPGHSGISGKEASPDRGLEREIVAMVPAAQSGVMVPGSQVSISFLGTPLFITSRADGPRS